MYNNKSVDDGEKKKNTNHTLIHQDERGCGYSGLNGEKLFLQRDDTEVADSFWHNMLDITTLNAFTILKGLQSSHMRGVTHARRLFIKELRKQLVMPLMRSATLRHCFRNLSRGDEEVRLDLP